MQMPPMNFIQNRLNRKMKINITTIILFLTWTSTVFGQTNFQKKYDSLSLKGSTTIYDYNNKKWIYSDSTDAYVETLPASTFKILNSLIALEYRAVENENEVFKWDGKPKYHLGTLMNAWNKDTDLKNAYKNSTIWFYEDVAKKVGRRTYRKVLKKTGYGNNDLTEKGVDFWNYGEFKVSPKNQIDFLVKLYENRLPFSKLTIDKVKQIMVSEQSEVATYRDKTGWTRKNGQDIGWWVGYVETHGNVYFFATRLIKNESENNANFLNGRKELTKFILNEIEKIDYR